MELGHPGAVLAPAHATGVAESHLQRCFPAEVVPFLRIGEPHMSHSLALGDLARAMLNSMGNRKVKHAPGLTPRNAKHTPTRPTAVSPTPTLRHTFCHLTPFFNCYTEEHTRIGTNRCVVTASSVRYISCCIPVMRC